MAKGDVTGALIYSIAAICLGSFQFGFHLSEMNAPEAVISCQQHGGSIGTMSWLPGCIEMSHKQYGIVVSAYTVGGLIGALIAGRAADRLGRRRSSMMNTLGFMIGPTVMALSTSIWTMCIGRFISGISSGFAMVVVPFYLAEMSTESLRGPVGVMNQFSVTVGILATQLLGLFLSSVPHWRLILAAGAAVGFIQLVALLFCSESPVWLALHQQLRDAKDVLTRLRGRSDVESELHAIAPHRDEDGAEEEGLLNPNSTNKESTTVGFWDFVSKKQYRHGCRTVVGVMLAQQFCGINSIVFYGVHILGQLSNNAALLNVYISTLNIGVTLLSAWLVTFLGRKTLLLISIAGMGICSVLLAVSMIQKIALLSATAALIFVSSFGIGLGPIPFILISDVNEPRAVGVAGSVALATNWISTFVVAYVFPILTDAFGGKAYFVFAAMAVLGHHVKTKVHVH